MLKVCLITTNLLPVPCVLGGAIEGLVTNIIDEQEIENKLDLTVVSIYNQEAFASSKNYHHTKFIYIKKNLSYMLTSIIYKTINKLFKTNLNTYNHMVLKKIKNMNFDYVVAEGGHYESYNKFLKYYKRNQLILHLHHQETSKPIIDKTFSRVLGVSNFIANDFATTTDKIATYTLYNGIKIDKFTKKVSTKELDALRAKYNLSSKDFVVLFCGRLIKEKGVLELIKAIKSIPNKDIKLLILGNNPFTNNQKDEYIKELELAIKGYEERIIFTGYINNWEVYIYYNLSDIVCIPSMWEDAATLVCVEAMLCKKVVLATNSGGIPEHLPKNASLVVEKGPKAVKNLKTGIMSLYNEREKLPEMGKIACNHAKRFNSQKMYLGLVNYLLKFYQEDKGDKNEI